MTVTELRMYPNCAHYTDDEANKIIRTLENLAVLLFEYTCHQNALKTKENMAYAIECIPNDFCDFL